MTGDRGKFYLETNSAPPYGKSSAKAAPNRDSVFKIVWSYITSWGWKSCNVLWNVFVINIWLNLKLQLIVSHLRWFSTPCVPCDNDHLVVLKSFNEACPILGHWQVCLALPELFQLCKLFALYKIEVDSKNGLEGGHGPFSQPIPVIMVWKEVVTFQLAQLINNSTFVCTSSRPRIQEGKGGACWLRDIRVKRTV